MTALIIGFLLVACVAGCNGANDVSRAAATLVGGGLASYARALRWVLGWTFAGSLASVVLAAGVAQRFAGAVTVGPAQLPFALAAVLLGAAAWLSFATMLRLPVATTHALFGGLIGVAWFTGGWDSCLRLHPLYGFVLPLISSPLISLTVAYAAQRGVAGLAQRPAGLIDPVHWLSSGLVAFSRGVNDSAKIWAMILPFTIITGLGPALLSYSGAAVVAVAMFLGAMLFGRRVTETFAFKVRRMGPLDSAVTNLSTAAVITAASFLTFPVASSHVVGGAILGTGLATGPGAISWRMLRDIATAWVVTLPVAAMASLTIMAALTAGAEAPVVTAAVLAAIAGTATFVALHGPTGQRVSDLWLILRSLRGDLIVFVCNSNTSRSPMAARICQVLLEREAEAPGATRPRYAIGRGLSATAGAPMPTQAMAGLLGLGVAPGRHRAAALSPAIARRARVIYCMTEQQVERARDMFPAAADRIVRLDQSRDIADPSRGGADLYTEVANLLQQAIRGRLTAGWHAPVPS